MIDFELRISLEDKKFCNGCPILSWSEKYDEAYCIIIGESKTLKTDSNFEHIKNGKFRWATTVFRPVLCPLREIKDENN